MRGKVWKRTMQAIGALIIGVMALFSYKGNKSQSMPAVSTLKDQGLAQCAPKPNCVSSFQEERDSEHYISPIQIKSIELGRIDEFFKACQQEVTHENYRYYTCRSRMFKFVDDIEVLYQNNKLFLRSASRVGHSDLGANRKRMEALRLFLTNH